jgi:hypothetical protein
MNFNKSDLLDESPEVGTTNTGLKTTQGTASSHQDGLGCIKQEEG